jgi:predicted CoA-binding protein
MSPDPRLRTVAVIGASSDRSKYGNKSVRAHLRAGYRVFPVNPRETSIEGLPVYRSVADIPEPLDRVTVYLPPKHGLRVIEEVARKGTKELFLNPGAESPELVARARALGLDPILACSIVDVGVSPASL